MGSSAESAVRIKGIVTYRVFSKGNFSICRVKDDSTGKTITVKGNDLSCEKGTHVQLTGEWQTTKQYGEVFDVSFTEIMLPSDREGVVKALRSLQVGVSSTTAEAIYKQFGERVWDVIQDTPYKLKEVGCSESLINKLAAKLKETQRLQSVIHSFGQFVSLVDTNKAQRVINRYKEDAERVVTEDPYRLCEMRGFAFHQIDNMALGRGGSPKDHSRILTALKSVLEAATRQGHVCLPLGTAMKETLDQLNMGRSSAEQVTGNDIREVVVEAKRADKLAYSYGMLYLKEQHAQEVFIATNITERLIADKNKAEDFDSRLEQYQEETGIKLAFKQAEAVKCALAHSVSVITGGPGTGKTTTVKALLYVHKLAYGSEAKPVLLAPTGKAARRMSEATGYPASTIHNAIGYTEKDGVQKVSIAIDGNLVVIDETSMMDQAITALLLQQIPPNTKIVFVGDPDQLPSVGCGNVLQDIIRSEVVPLVRLDVIYRQGQDSPIITNAHRINRGETDLAYAPQFQFVTPSLAGEQDEKKRLRDQKEAAVITDMLFERWKKEHPGQVPTVDDESMATFIKAVNLYCTCAKKYGIENVVLLCPYRNWDKASPEHILCTNNLNKILQEMLNPWDRDRYNFQIVSRHGTFRAGDKVMQVRNADVAKNGDTGYIRRTVRYPDPKCPSDWIYYAIIEWNDDGKECEYSAVELQNVDLAYCTTIHKSQGSQYETVIMIVSNEHSMLRRNLVYTGVTRAEKNVILVGNEAALEKAILDGTTTVRNSLLADRLHSKMKHKQ